MESILKFSNWALFVTFFAFCVSIFVAYPWASEYSLQVQVFAHIGSVLFPVGVKAAYVVRLTALKNLRRPVW